MSLPFDYSEFIGVSREDLERKVNGFEFKAMSQEHKAERLDKMAREQRDIGFAAKCSLLILRSLLRRFDDGRLTCPLTSDQLKGD